MSVLKTVTLLANAMIHSGTGLIGFANDEPVVRVLAFAPQNLRLNKNEWNKQSKRGILFIFYNQLTERKDWDVFIACVYGPVYPPWVCPPGNDSFTVCVLYLFLTTSPPSPYFSVSLSSRKKDQQNEMYKWQLCWCKGMQAGGPNVWSHTSAQLESLGWSEKFANSLTGSLWYHNGCMWRGWWDSKAGSCCSWPTPPALVPFDLDVSVTYAPIACPSMPSSFISLFLYHSVLYFSWGCFFLSYMEKIMKVFESKLLCCGYLICFGL